MISVVVETFNLANGELAPLARSIAILAPSLSVLGAELVITTTGPRIALGYPARWIEVRRETSYYDHKLAGFEASHGRIVAFLDGDCAPTAGWLDAIIAPFATGARVVAGATSYPGPLARIANEMDFPYFDGANRRYAARSAPASPGRTAPTTVQNFFANNVAFARGVFAAHPYRPAPMFHGQCQLLALELRAAGISIAHAPDAYVEHAWPSSARELVVARLLRGADFASLLPHIVRAHHIRMTRPGPVSRLAAVAVLGLRGLLSASRSRSSHDLAFVAIATLLDSLGAATMPLVYSCVGVPVTRPWGRPPSLAPEARPRGHEPSCSVIAAPSPTRQIGLGRGSRTAEHGAGWVDGPREPTARAT